MLELLLWFSWAGAWFWALEKLPFRESVRRVSWVFAALGIPLVWAVSKLPLQERVVMGVFGGLALAVFVIIAWLSSDPPKADASTESPAHEPRSPRVCYREQEAKRCSAPPCAASRGGDRRQAAPQRRRAPAPCAGLEPVKRVVTQVASMRHRGASYCSDRLLMSSSRR